MTLARREFLTAAGGALLALVSGRAGAQGAVMPKRMSGPMDETRYRPVALPAKPGGAPVLTRLGLDAVEHEIHCQCGCTLDIYTCRTTDFTCPVSPAMHADVLRLAAGGYSAAEILTAFAAVYGERVLMSPVRRGFNWAGYLAPSVALAVGAVTLTLTIVRWQRRSVERVRATLAEAPAAGIPVPGAAAATPDELARLAAALRHDDR